MIDYVEVLNQDNGERGRITRRWFESPRINPGILVEVDPDQKPYVPELFKSRIATETDAPVVKTADADQEED